MIVKKFTEISCTRWLPAAFIFLTSKPESKRNGFFPQSIVPYCVCVCVHAHTRVAISSSRGSSQPRDWTHISLFCCVAGRFFTSWASLFFIKSHVHSWTRSNSSETQSWKSRKFSRFLALQVYFVENQLSNSAIAKI